MKSELEKLYSHIQDIEVAMMVTRRGDGHLQSRAMATQKRAPGADLWFVTLDNAQKLLDIECDPHVNLSYY
jgi:general stress protein 26